MASSFSDYNDDDETTEFKRKLASLRSFSQVKAIKKPKKANWYTVTGKSLSNPELTDLYQYNSAPSLNFLRKFTSEIFTDEEGRRYWRVPEASDFKWDRRDLIEEESWFDSKNCKAFFVRPKPRTDLTLPEEGSQLDLYVGTVRVHTGTVRKTGDDEEGMNPEKTSRRKTSFIVLQFNK